MSADRVVFVFPKYNCEEVRAMLRSFHGHRLADVRVWAADADDNDVPAKKGIAVKVEDLPRRREAVDTLIEADAEERAA